MICEQTQELPEVQIHKSHDGRVVAAIGRMAQPSHLAAILTQDTGLIGWILQFSGAGPYLQALVDHSVLLGIYLRLWRLQEHSLEH